MSKINKSMLTKLAELDQNLCNTVMNGMKNIREADLEAFKTASHIPSCGGCMGTQIDCKIVLQ